MVVLDRYRAVAKLGSGGQGQVWRAVDEHGGRDVAVKIYGEVASFDTELYALQHVQSPHVPTFVDSDRESLAIVRELPDGPTLEHALHNGVRIDWRAAVDDMTRVQEALVAAGLSTGGDVLKPTSIVVSSRGLVVVDLGNCVRTDKSVVWRREDLIVFLLHTLGWQPSAASTAELVRLNTRAREAFERGDDGTPWINEIGRYLPAMRRAELALLDPDALAYAEACPC